MVQTFLQLSLTDLTIVCYGFDAEMFVKDCVLFNTFHLLHPRNKRYSGKQILP